MAYADFTAKVIIQSMGRFQTAVSAATKKGDLLGRSGALAEADAGIPAYSVAIEDGAASAVIWAAKWAVVRKPSTIAVGGKPTAATHGASIDDALWLSATGGKASATAIATIAQLVGHAVSTQDIILEPGEVFESAELITSAKTVDVQDVGKTMIATADAVVFTLPATATEFEFLFVNGGNDGAQLMSISPASDDLITGPNYAGTDNKDWQNTQATARPGDRLRVKFRTATGYVVTEKVGVWYNET